MDEDDAWSGEGGVGEGDDGVYIGIIRIKAIGVLLRDGSNRFFSIFKIR